MAGRSASLRFILLSVCVLVVSADQRIFTRHTGMNVTLEFPVPTDTTSVWLKRPGSDKYIFYCRDGHPTHLEHREESFKGRVEGTDCVRINGTISVTVRNLTPNDSGPYEFHCRESDKRSFNETIFLNVTDPGQRGGHTTEDGGKEDGVRREHPGLVACLSVFGLIILVLLIKKKQAKIKNLIKKLSETKQLATEV